MSTPSIFSRIINGEIPSHKIYEDERTLAFLDIHPAAPGHVLVVPKTEVEFVWDLPDDDYRALMNTVKKVARRLKAIMKTPYIGSSVIGTDVPHAHVHLVPFTTTDQVHAVIRARDEIEPDHEELATLADKLRF